MALRASEGHLGRDGSPYDMDGGARTRVRGGVCGAHRWGATGREPLLCSVFDTGEVFSNVESLGLAGAAPRACARVGGKIPKMKGMYIV